MPQDLNLKKSWNPKLLKNREKVWKREREVLEEHRKAQQRQKELQDVNDKSELLSLNRDGPQNVAREEYKTTWMYRDDPDEGKDSNEDFLLGRKKLDALVKEKVKKPVTVSRMNEVINAGVQPADGASEILDREDPMNQFQQASRSRRGGRSSHNYSQGHHHHHHHHRHQSSRDQDPHDSTHTTKSYRQRD